LSFDTAAQQPRSISWAKMNDAAASPRNVTRGAVADLNRRTIIVHIEGHRTAERLRTDSVELLQCRGAPEQFELFAVHVDGARYCRQNARLRSKKKYIAMLSADVAVQIICTDDLIGCRVSFPFEHFAPTVVFHQDRLSEGKNVVRGAVDFLRSKKSSVRSGVSLQMSVAIQARATMYG
jgi:hypothetical protein